MQALAQADIQVAGLEHEIRSLSYKLEELKRDREADARAHELWTPALDVFGLWRTVTGKIEGKNRRIQLSGERFYLVLPFLKSEGEGECQQAVIGRCADHYTSTRQANGSTIHYWEWERIFGSMGQGQTARSNFEESRDRAPDNWQRWVVKAGYEVAT